VSNATIQVQLHDTPQAWWDALARVFPVWTQNGTSGIRIETDGVTVNVYGPSAKTEGEASA